MKRFIIDVKVCVCYFLSTPLEGKSTSLGHQRGVVGKSSSLEHQKGAGGGGWEEKGENTPLDHPAETRRRDRVLAKSSCPSALSINKTPACCVGIIVSTLN